MKRLSMRNIREALWLRSQGFSPREMALSLLLGRTTMRGYFQCADDVGSSWPLPIDLTDARLEQLLFPGCTEGVRDIFPQPDRSYIHTKLRLKGVTLSLLWEEYRGVHPDGYG